MEIFESLIPVGIVLLCIAGVVALGAMAYLFITLTKSMKEEAPAAPPQTDGCTGRWLCDTAEEAVANAKAAQVEILGIRLLIAEIPLAANDGAGVLGEGTQGFGYGREAFLLDVLSGDDHHWRRAFDLRPLDALFLFLAHLDDCVKSVRGLLYILFELEAARVYAGNPVPFHGAFDDIFPA